MANRHYYPSRSNGAGRVYVDFEVLGASNAALTYSTGAAAMLAAVGVGITRSNTGIFAFTMKDAWNKVVSAQAEIDDTADDGADATIGNITNEGTSTPLQFTLRVRGADGTKADPAVGRRIWVRLAFRNTTGWGSAA